MLRPLHRLADRLAAAFGVAPAARETILTGMMAHQAKDAPAYWLQLLLSMGLASLGLALGSTAVIIGAMLISPLMGPVVDLSMGFAIGSPYLTIRSFSRLAGSIIAVVAGGALIALALPFHEMTPQILSRIHPNVLDLAIAIFCALAAAFTTVRSGAATSATAAGTAVGIALVPPLCVAGYGLGVGKWTVAGGASLLFTANVCAILLFAGLVFLALGFGSLDVQGLERAALVEARASRPTVRVARWLGSLFAGRYSILWRLLVPVALVAVVFVPLLRALSEVSWQVRVRADVESVLKRAAQEAVQTTTRVEGRVVTVQLVIVGSTDDAHTLETALHDRLASIRGGLDAHVRVIAVPDATLVEETEGRLSPPVVTAAPATASDIRRRLDDILRAEWPAKGAGTLDGWSLALGSGQAPARVTVVHRGDALGPVAEELLAHRLLAAGGPVVIADVPLPVDELRASPAEATMWLQTLHHAIEASAIVPTLRLCVGLPSARSLHRVAGGSARLAEARGLLQSLPSDRVDAVESERWSLRIVEGPCAADAQ